MTDDTRKLINSHDVISFDMWDTIQLRPFARPRHLFTYIGGIEYFGRRLIAEREARQKAQAQGRKEVRYSDFGTAADMLAEREAERDTSFRNPEVAKWLEYAKAQNKRVIIISDFYLALNDLAGDTPSYWSCEENETKADGGLFEVVRKRQNIPQGAKWLHIDDNPVCCETAKAHGITPLLYEKRIRRLARLYPRLKTIGAYSLPLSVWAGLWAAWDARNAKAPYWVKLGYQLAPMLYGYAQWIHTQADADNIDTLAFVMRDGHQVEKIYRALFPSDKRKIVKVYASRAMAETRKDYKTYIKSLKLFGNVAIIDGCAFRHTSFKLLSIANAFNYVWFHRTGDKWPHDPSHRCKAYSTVNDFTKCAFKNFDALELLLSAPEPPCVDIVRNKPVFKATPQESARVEIVKQILSGVDAFVADAKPLKVVFDFDSVLRILNSFFQNKSADDKRMLSTVMHSSLPNHNNPHPI